MTTRLRGLDVLRGVLILLVVGYHDLVKSAGALAPLQLVWSRVGWVGVDLFFVLSGFLVGGLLMAEIGRNSALDVRRFLLRRWLKIWPGYYAYLLAITIYLRRGKGVSWRSIETGIAPFMIHIQNYSNIYHPEGKRGLGELGARVDHLWSIAVEEHFYLLLPLLLWGLTRRGLAPFLRWFPRGVVALLGGCLLLRLWNMDTPYNNFTHHWPTHLRVDALGLGAGLAFLRQFRPTAWAALGSHPARLLAAAVPLLMPSLLLDRKDPLLFTVGFSSISFGCAALVVAFVGLAERSPGRAFSSRGARALAFVGLHSYSIYLWHLFLAQPLGFAAANLPALAASPTLRWLVYMLVFQGAAVLSGVVLGRLIEFPVLAIRDRVYPARADIHGEVACPDAPTEPR